MAVLPAVIGVSVAGVAQLAPCRSASPSPAVAAWAVLNGLGRSYDHVCFHLVYARGCGDPARGLIQHPERVLGLPTP